jgi:hypothetical protein
VRGREGIRIWRGRVRDQLDIALGSGSSPARCPQGAQKQGGTRDLGNADRAAVKQQLGMKHKLAGHKNFCSQYYHPGHLPDQIPQW